MVGNLVPGRKQGNNNNSKQLQNAYQVPGTVLYHQINSFNPHYYLMKKILLLSRDNFADEEIDSKGNLKIYLGSYSLVNAWFGIRTQATQLQRPRLFLFFFVLSAC